MAKKYLIMKKTNWAEIGWILLSGILALSSFLSLYLMYKPIFLFYMPFLRDIITTFLGINSLIWAVFSVMAIVEYRPKEEKFEIKEE